MVNSQWRNELPTRNLEGHGRMVFNRAFSLDGAMGVVRSLQAWLRGAGWVLLQGAGADAQPRKAAYREGCWTQD